MSKDKITNGISYSAVTVAIVAVLLNYFPSLDSIREPMYVIVNVLLVALKNLWQSKTAKK